MKKSFLIVDTAIVSANIPATAFKIYVAIMSHSRGKDSHIFPSYSRIADMVGVTKNCVYKNVKILEKRGFLQKTHRFLDNGGCTTNEYTPYDGGNTPPVLQQSDSPYDGGNTPPVLQQSDSPVLQQSDSPYDGGNTRNKKSKYNKKFKIFNNARTRTREENATGEAQRTPEQTDIEDFVPNNHDRSIKEAMRGLGKSEMWLDLVRIGQTYYLRPVHKGKISAETIATDCQILSNRFGCDVRPLEVGKFYADEIKI